jgi:hypothetical protein
MRLTHWQYLAATKQLHKDGVCEPNGYHRASDGGCLNCGHDPKRDYKITFEVVK